MGSSGTGRLSDYSGTGSGSSGGSSGKNKCSETINEQLEDVARCDYYINNNDVPPIGTQVSLIQEGRITVTTLTGEKIGFLPTEYNYLAGCLANGYSYSGTIVQSANTRIPAVLVKLEASI